MKLIISFVIIQLLVTSGISATTCPLPHPDYTKLRDRIDEFKKKILKQESSCPGINEVISGNTENGKKLATM